MKVKNLTYLSATALILSSCMSMDALADIDPEKEIPSINGTICSEDSLPIEHIMVTASWGSGMHDDVVYTSSEGKFSIQIHEELIGKESDVTLVIEDIDGIENGGEFETLTDRIILFPENEDYTSDSISLDYQMIRATREESSPQS